MFWKKKEKRNLIVLFHIVCNETKKITFVNVDKKISKDEYETLYEFHKNFYIPLGFSVMANLIED